MTMENLVPIKRAVITTFNNWGLKDLVLGLVAACPDIEILSTGATLKEIHTILGPNANERLTSIEEFIGHVAPHPGVPRTQDWRLTMGMLYEQELHAGLEQFGVAPIELLVCNVSLFGASAGRVGLDIEWVRRLVEVARLNLIRAGIRGLHRCMVLTSPEDYSEFLHRLQNQSGSTSIMDRAQFAAKAMGTVANLDADVARFLRNLTTSDPKEVYASYQEAAAIPEEALKPMEAAAEAAKPPDTSVEDFLAEMQEEADQVDETGYAGGELSPGDNEDDAVDPDGVDPDDPKSV